MRKSEEQKKVIEKILKDAKKRCKRTVYEIASYCGDAETRSTYYRALSGAASDEVQIAVFMACNAPASLFENYCSACGIYLGQEYLYSRMISDYIYTHDSEYDLFELDESLIAANQPSLIKERVA